MWQAPRHIILTVGSGQNKYQLVAFDKALLNADIGNYNLIRVSSIIPPYANIHMLMEDQGLRLLMQYPEGVLLPTVYSSKASDEVGQTIATALALGVPTNRKRAGVIFETALVGNRVLAEEVVTDMVVNALAAREIDDYQLITISVDQVVKQGESACVVAAAVLLP